MKFQVLKISSVAFLSVFSLAGCATSSPTPPQKLAQVNSVQIQILESFPVQATANIKGNLTNGCQKLDASDQKMEGNKFKITLPVVETGEICTQALVPFEQNIPLQLQSLKKGSYIVDVNGVMSNLNLDTDNFLQPAKNDENVAQPMKVGNIEGSLSYPSESIPPMKVCIENPQKELITCTNKRIANKKYTYGFGYTLSVPPGNYFAYAILENTKNTASDLEGYKAYYSEYVKCGIKVECKDHSPIQFTVEEGKTTPQIDVTDWYNYPQQQ